MLVMQRLAAHIVPAIQHIPWMLTAAPWPGGVHSRPLRHFLFERPPHECFLARPHNSRCEISRLPILDHCCQHGISDGADSSFAMSSKLGDA